MTTSDDEPTGATEPEDAADPGSGQGGVRRTAGIAAIVATLAILGTLGWFWKQSLIPDTYSVMSMGYPDYGGGPVPDDAMAMDGMRDTDAMASHTGAAGHGAGVSVATLVGPSRPADVSVTLTARAEEIQLAGPHERTVTGFTLNHTSPGPEITVRKGELLEVRLVNESVPDGVTLHWHGVDVPNGEDGVAGVTQDAVEQGEDFVYRFVVPDPGTYWYHSHQVADEQVSKGLFGALVVLPPSGGTEPSVAADAVATVHSYDGSRTVNGTTDTDWVAAESGRQARIRVVNTNNGPLRTWVTGSTYQVLAIDGHDLHEPTDIESKTLDIPAGGRADLLVTAPSDGTAAAVNLGGGIAVAVGPPDAEVVSGDAPSSEVDLLSYGTPAPLGLDPDAAQRHFEYDIGRRVGFLDGKPGFWWTINGHLYPDVPMFMVQEGDVVVMTIKNGSGQVHPMHLHGHHAVVLSRDGEPSTGSPWWVDSLDVEDGERYDVALVADNPGIWMDHCHNLEHASQGLVTHLMYAGVTTPYLVGGDDSNDPE